MLSRKTNFEVLRIVAMIMVICGHVTINSNKLGAMGTVDYFITNFIQSYCVCATNVFILLSGYWGIHLKRTKLIKMDVRVIFYSIIFLFISVMAGTHIFSHKTDFFVLFPVITKKYWFITDYFVLSLLAPYLNIFLEKINKEELKRLLILCFVLFYLIATMAFAINAGQIVLDAGYGIVNFIYLYFLGYYLRHYFVDKLNNMKWLLGFMVNSLCLFISNAVMTKVCGFYFNSFVSYNTVFVLGGAVCLFMFFKNTQMQSNRVINFIASKTLWVYVIHMSDLSSVIKPLYDFEMVSGYMLVFCIFVITIGIYLGCTFIAILVDLLLQYVDNGVEKFGRKIFSS